MECVEKYFSNQIKKCFVTYDYDRGEYPLEPWIEDHKNTGDCWFASIYSLMGMNPTDKVYYGEPSRLPSGQNPALKKYRHMWLDFKFENKNYVLNCWENFIISAEENKDLYNPIITSEYTQSEIIDRYAKNKLLSTRIGNEITIKHIDTGYGCKSVTVYDEKERYDINREENDKLYYKCVVAPMRKAKITLNSNGTIQKFIGIAPIYG